MWIEKHPEDWQQPPKFQLVQKTLSFCTNFKVSIYTLNNPVFVLGYPNTKNTKLRVSKRPEKNLLNFVIVRVSTGHYKNFQNSPRIGSLTALRKIFMVGVFTWPRENSKCFMNHENFWKIFSGPPEDPNHKKLYKIILEAVREPNLKEF